MDGLGICYALSQAAQKKFNTGACSGGLFWWEKQASGVGSSRPGGYCGYSAVDACQRMAEKVQGTTRNCHTFPQHLARVGGFSIFLASLWSAGLGERWRDLLSPQLSSQLSPRAASLWSVGSGDRWCELSPQLSSLNSSRELMVG